MPTTPLKIEYDFSEFKDLGFKFESDDETTDYASLSDTPDGSSSPDTNTDNATSGRVTPLSPMGKQSRMDETPKSMRKALSILAASLSSAGDPVHWPSYQSDGISSNSQLPLLAPLTPSNTVTSDASKSYSPSLKGIELTNTPAQYRALWPQMLGLVDVEENQGVSARNQAKQFWSAKRRLPIAPRLKNEEATGSSSPQASTIGQKRKRPAHMTPAPKVEAKWRPEPRKARLKRNSSSASLNYADLNTRGWPTQSRSFLASKETTAKIGSSNNSSKQTTDAKSGVSSSI